MICTICKTPIAPGRSVYREVVGFVKDRKDGGANQIRRKKPTGRHAHVSCVENVVPEQIPGQLSLT